MGRRPLSAVLVGLVAATGACAGSRGAVVPRRQQTGAIQWTRCDKVECGRLSVPLDFTRPNGPQIELALARIPASRKRIGVLFTNPGGPGGSGGEVLRRAGGAFPRALPAPLDPW